MDALPLLSRELAKHRTGYCRKGCNTCLKVNRVVEELGWCRCDLIEYSPISVKGVDVEFAGMFNIEGRFRVAQRLTPGIEFTIDQELTLELAVDESGPLHRNLAILANVLDALFDRNHCGFAHGFTAFDAYRAGSCSNILGRMTGFDQENSLRPTSAL